MPVLLIIIRLMMILYNLSMYECIYGMGTMSLMMGAGIGDSSLRLDISWEFKVMLMIISNILI